jgi:hypothetical protein
MILNTPDQWRGPGFTVTVAAGLVCPRCKAPIRASGMSVYRGVTELSCRACHDVLVEVEQRPRALGEAER